jgi:hypothetical protein
MYKKRGNAPNPKNTMNPNPNPNEIEVGFSEGRFDFSNPRFAFTKNDLFDSTPYLKIPLVVFLFRTSNCCLLFS